MAWLPPWLRFLVRMVRLRANRACMPYSFSANPSRSIPTGIALLLSLVGLETFLSLGCWLDPTW